MSNGGPHEIEVKFTAPTPHVPVIVMPNALMMHVNVIVVDPLQAVNVPIHLSTPFQKSGTTSPLRQSHGSCGPLVIVIVAWSVVGSGCGQHPVWTPTDDELDDAGTALTDALDADDGAVLDALTLEDAALTLDGDLLLDDTEDELLEGLELLDEGLLDELELLLDEGLLELLDDEHGAVFVLTTAVHSPQVPWMLKKNALNNGEHVEPGCAWYEFVMPPIVTVSTYPCAASSGLTQQRV